MADPKENVNITGTSSVTYDMDELQRQSRTNGNLALVVQVYKYRKGESPNPTDLQEGQLWYSKFVSDNK